MLKCDTKWLCIGFNMVEEQCIILFMRSSHLKLCIYFIITLYTHKWLKYLSSANGQRTTAEVLFMGSFANSSHKCTLVKYMVTVLKLKQNDKLKVHPNKMTCSVGPTVPPTPFSFKATCSIALHAIRSLHEYYY